jgi:hypothetical protein
MVVKLDNGKYRSIELSKVKSIFTDPNYVCGGTIEPGPERGVGPETDKPDWAPELPKESVTTGGGNGDGEDNGDDPICVWVNGVIVCV